MLCEVRKEREVEEGKTFTGKWTLLSYLIEGMWLQALAMEGRMIALSKWSCPGINKQRHAEENTNTHPHGVLGVWRLHCVKRGRYTPNTKELKPDCSDNTATAFISYGMSAWQHLPPHTQTLMLFYPAERVCAREEVSGADTEYIFICMQAHELSVSGEEDKGFFLSTMYMWVTGKETEWEKRDAFRA